jgi:hypothetical protein
MGTGVSADKKGSSPRNDIDNDFEQVEVNKQDADADEAAAAAAVEESKSEELVMNDMSKSTVLIEKPRRIVKATPPTSTGGASGATTTTTTTTTAPGDHHHPDDDQGDDDDDKHNASGTGGGADNSLGITTDEELLQDSIEQNRNKRMQQLAQKQKSDRQHVTDERRKQSAPVPRAQANPFSRFLSAFSVESQFPSHKRKDYHDEDDDLPPKKQGRTDGDEGDSGDDDHDKKKNYLDWTWIATATAVAAVGFVLAMRYRKNR